MSILYTMCVPHPPLIIPEIGQGEEKTISNTIQSYESIMKYVSTLPIETVIVSVLMRLPIVIIFIYLLVFMHQETLVSFMQEM